MHPIRKFPAIMSFGLALLISQSTVADISIDRKAAEQLESVGTDGLQLPPIDNFSPGANFHWFRNELLVFQLINDRNRFLEMDPLGGTAFVDILIEIPSLKSLGWKRHPKADVIPRRRPR